MALIKFTNTITHLNSTGSEGMNYPQNNLIKQL